MNRENNVNSHILLYIQNTGVRFYGKCPLWLQCFVLDLRSFPCAFQFIRGGCVLLQGFIIQQLQILHFGFVVVSWF